MTTIDALSLQSRVKLNDGYDIPILGFGTYEMGGRDAYRAVTYALEAGYRLIVGIRDFRSALSLMLPHSRRTLQNGNTKVPVRLGD